MVDDSTVFKHPFVPYSGTFQWGLLASRRPGPGSPAAR
jgi:hypothetical protein